MGRGQEETEVEDRYRRQQKTGGDRRRHSRRQQETAGDRRRQKETQ